MNIGMHSSGCSWSLAGPLVLRTDAGRAEADFSRSSARRSASLIRRDSAHGGSRWPISRSPSLRCRARTALLRRWGRDIPLRPWSERQRHRFCARGDGVTVSKYPDARCLDVGAWDANTRGELAAMHIERASRHPAYRLHVASTQRATDET